MIEHELEPPYDQINPETGRPHGWADPDDEKAVEDEWASGWGAAMAGP